MVFYLLPPDGEAKLLLLYEAAHVRANVLISLLEFGDGKFDDILLELHNNGDAQFIIERSSLDVLSHFILSFLLLDDDCLGKFFIHAELELFRHRVGCLNAFEIGSALRDLHRQTKRCANLPVEYFNTVEAIKQLGAGRFSRALKRQDSTTVVHVPFVVVTELVAKRLVQIRKGRAIVPALHFFHILQYLFVTPLQARASELSRRAVGNVDSRFSPIAADLKLKVKGWLEAKMASRPPFNFTLFSSKVDDAAQCFPPCMLTLHRKLRAIHRLPHMARVVFTLFLKDIGMPMEESVKFWRNEYSVPTGCCKVDCTHSWQKDHKRYEYGISHLYGLTGARKLYKSSCCHSLQSVALQEGCKYGCPFKYTKDEDLSNFLCSNYSITHSALQQVFDQRKAGNYNQCCKIVQNFIQNNPFTNSDYSNESCQNGLSTEPFQFEGPVDMFYLNLKSVSCHLDGERCVQAKMCKCFSCL